MSRRMDESDARAGIAGTESARSNSTFGMRSFYSQAQANASLTFVDALDPGLHRTDIELLVGIVEDDPVFE